MYITAGQCIWTVTCSAPSCQTPMSGAQRHPTVQFNQRCDQLDPVVLVVCGRSWRNNIGVGGAAMCAVMGDLVRGARDQSSGCRSWRCGVHSRRLRVSGFLFTTPSMLPCVKLNAQRLATTPKIMQMLPSSPSCPQVWAGRALAQILRTSLALCIQRRRCM